VLQGYTGDSQRLSNTTTTTEEIAGIIIIFDITIMIITINITITIIITITMTLGDVLEACVDVQFSANRDIPLLLGHDATRTGHTSVTPL
jgi:hypothetical protein